MMMLWDEHEWREVTDDEVNVLLNDPHRRHLFVCPNIDGNGALDPAMWIVTAARSIPACKRMHENYRKRIAS